MDDLARLAARQHNLLSARQCRDLGVSPRQVERRLRTGWREVHRGVYALAPARLTPPGLYLAAVLATGPDAFASHRTAAALHGLQPHHYDAPHVVSTTRKRPRTGIHVHWTRSLRPQETATRQGIPITSLIRTLQDLAEVASPDEQEEAIRAAERLHRLDRRHLAPIAGRRGAANTTGTALYRGTLEPVFRRLVREAGIAPYEPNARIGDFEVDAYWPAQRLAVEIDDYDTHLNRNSFDADRRRDRVLAVAGIRVVRVTARDLTTGKATLVNHLRALGAPSG